MNTLIAIISVTVATIVVVKPILILGVIAMFPLSVGYQAMAGIFTKPEVAS